VRHLLDETLDAGAHTTRWDGRSDAGESVAAGIYFYRLETGGFSHTRRLTCLR
jgi:flagellar hook assembly protein FlgD